VFKKLKRKLHPITLSKGLEIMASVNPNSAGWYKTGIQHLIDSHGDISITSVTTEHLNSWAIRINKDGLSPWTVDSYIRSLKSYFNKMVALGHLDKSPAAQLRLPKLPPKRPKDIKLENVEKLLSAAKYDLRDYTMIRLLYDSGARVGELLSMTVSNVDFNDDGGRALVKGKGNKIRWVFFGVETAESLKAWIECRPVNSPDALWLSKKGGSTVTAKPLSKSGVYLMLRRTAGRAGVDRFNPHAFRHAFAKRMIDSGMPMRLVQELMGHTDIKVTMSMYANYDEIELQGYYKRFNKDQRPLPSSPLTTSEP
jgi:site-specific recombinase XerD